MLSGGTQNVTIFKYLGLDIIQINKYVSLSQMKFINEIKKPEISGISKRKHLGLNEEELKGFRVLIGRLLWAPNQTCPDIFFNLGKLNSSVNYATVKHILRANKLIKMAKSNQ